MDQTNMRTKKEIIQQLQDAGAQRDDGRLSIAGEQEIQKALALEVQIDIRDTLIVITHKLERVGNIIKNKVIPR